MDMKYLILGGIGLAAAYYFLSTDSGTSYAPQAPTGYSGATAVPPNGTYGNTGVINDTGAWNWLTATGNLVNSLGTAFANIYPLTSGSATTPAARGLQMTLTEYFRLQYAPTGTATVETVSSIPGPLVY